MLFLLLDWRCRIDVWLGWLKWRLLMLLSRSFSRVNRFVVVVVVVWQRPLYSSCCFAFCFSVM
jgi:hypothetical protein